MDQQNQRSMTMWIIAGAVIVIILLLGWWYFSQQSTVANDTTNTNTQTGQEVKSSQKFIASFAFEGLDPKVSGVVNNINYTVALTVPGGTVVKKLIPNIQVADFASIMPVSGAVQDFTNPVRYTVAAEDGTTQTYTVTVNVAK